MCKYAMDIKNITDAYGKEMLSENGQKMFKELPMDFKVRFITTHPSQ